MFKNIKSVTSIYLKSISYVNKNNLRRYYLISGLINIIIFILFIGFGKIFYDWLKPIITNNLSQYIYEFLLSSFAIIITFLLTFIFFFVTYKNISLIIMSPFLSKISLKVEFIKNGKQYNFTNKDELRFIWRAIKLNLKAFLIEFSLVVFLVLLGLIPLLGFITVPLIFIIQSFFSGFGFMDPVFERHLYSDKQSFKFALKHFSATAILGFYHNLTMLIPVLGICIAPVLTTVASTNKLLQLMEVKND